ncbi:ATP-binding cassette sub-family A member 13 [Alca torda]
MTAGGAHFASTTTEQWSGKSVNGRTEDALSRPTFVHRLINPALEMDLNEVEEMISRAESLYKQPYFWNLLHSLPHLESNSFYTEDGLAAIAQFLKVIQNTLASLKDLAMMPLGKSFYEMVKTALNLTAALIEERSLEGFQYNLSLRDVLWNPHAVRAELESRFGFDDLHVEKLLNYTAQLKKIPTGETLEQFVCSALASVPEDEANKENNEEGCISARHEAKLYLVHGVSKLRLYAQVFEQWLSSNLSQKLLLELDDLVSQFLDDRKARKIFSEINTQQWNEKSDAYFSEGYTASHDLILQRMQYVLKDVPQWPVTKRLLLVDGAIRNMLMSNASYICDDVLRTFEKTLRLPQGSDDIDILAIYGCPGNGSEVTFKLSNQVKSLRESVLLLQKVTQGQQSLPDSIMDGYLGWQEIEEQLTKNYAYYCEINQLLSSEAPSEEDVHFSSCQEQLVFSLINNTLEDILFAFEGNPYWKDLTTFVSWTCEVAQYMNEEAGSMGDQSDRLEASLCLRQKLSLETILGHYLTFLQDLPDYSSFISRAWILTAFKGFLNRQENLQISGEKEMDHLFHLVEVIDEIIMLDFSASSNQSLIENVLNNTITWMKNFAEGKESATNFSLAVFELHNELQKNFKPLQRFWMKEKIEIFWHIVRIIFYELDSRLSHLSQVEEEEVLETLSRIIFSIRENKIHNRSVLLLQNILTDWPELNIPALNHLKHLSEIFLRTLYEVRSLADDHVDVSSSTIHGVSNTSSLLLSNATFIYKVQELEEIVHNFFKTIQKLNSSSVASLVPILFSLYQNDDLVLNFESNSTLLTFLYETSKDISSFQVWHDLQDRDRVFDFLSETFDLLWNFTSESLCEKLLIVYNYTEFQAQSLAQKGKKEMQVVYSTLSSLKTLFMDKELQTAAFCYLEQFLGISPGCLVNNTCIDFYLSNITSVDQSEEVYSLLLLPLDSVLSNITNLGDKVSVPSALDCAFTWLQSWTEIFEEASKILNLDSTFFVHLRNDLANLSESLLNATHDKLCNNTAMVIVEAATAAMNLLKIMFEGGGDLNDWKDFEALLASLQNVFINAVDVTNSLKGNSLESVLDMMGVMITELQKSILKIANGEFLNSWLDTFISGGPKGEDRGAGVFSIGNSLSAVLKLSQKELGIILTEIKDTAAFFESVPQGKYIVCISVLQNITKLILDSTLKDISHSQTNFSSHLNSFLNFYSTVDEAEDCNRWMHALSNLSEKYKSPSHLESAKHILFLLKSLGNIETDAKLRNVMDFVNLIFNLILPECSLTGSDVICENVYFNIIAKTLRFIVPEFYVKDDIGVLEQIFTLLNNSGGQIQMVVNDLVGHSQYTSNKTHFSQSIHEFNRTSRMFLNSFHHVYLSSVELLAEIQTLLQNKKFEIQENSSSHLDIGIEPFLHEKNTSLLMEFVQHVISKLDSDFQGEQKIFLQKLIETAALNIELVRKALKIFKSSSFTGFPLRDDKEFLKHMVALVQNMRNVDVEFLISQLKQVQGSLDNFFKSIKPLDIEISELRILTDWWDEFENNSCNWNLTGLWQITRVFKQDELYDVEEMFHLLLDVIGLTERLAHGNITEALTEVYTFILTQEEKMPMFTKEEFSNQVESLLMLLDTLTDMSDEPAESSICFSASFCWTLTTATPQSDPTFKPCDFMHSNSTPNYDAVIEVIREMKLITLDDSSSCAMEDFQTDITRNLTCFFLQIKEWNSILLKFSELHHINSAVLRELLDFWNELSVHAVPLQVNNTSSINCSSTLKRQVALQIVETLASMPVAEMEMAKGVLEHLHDLYDGLSWNRHSRTSFIKTVLTNVKNMTSEVAGLLDTEAVLSFISVMQPLMTLSSLRNQTYSMLTILSALNGNNNISDTFENFWFPIVTSIEDLLVNFNVRHLLAVIDQEFQLLRLATGQSSSMAHHDLIQQFNTSSVDAMLRNFEGIQEILNRFLCECNNKNYSKIMHALIFLMADENSSNDLLLFVKDIIDFLELFQNKSKEDYTGMLFADGRLSREKLNNAHTANSVLLNSFLHRIADLSVIEEFLHANNTELQIVDFIDSFFDNAQYREVSTQSQNRTLEIMQEILQMIFQSTIEHDRKKITFLLKDLHEDIMAEMRASKICKILQKRLYPTSFLLLQKLQFTILNVLKIFSDMKVKECVQNLTQLRMDIGSSVNISEETISTILEASISHSKVFYSAFLVALTGRCDEEVLSLLLKLPENSKTSLVVEELCSLPALDLYTTFVMIIKNLNLRHIIYKIKIPSEIGNVLNMLLDVVSSISSLLNKAHHVMENFPVFLQAIQDLGVLDISALQQFLQGGQFRSSAVGSLESVIKTVCKEESSFFSNANLFIDMPRIMGLLEDNMAKYGIPEDSTPFCLKLYQEILQSSNGALLWTFLKPLLHGKILYNSNIDMIDLVMEKANFTFGFVENLKTYSETWLRLSEVFKTSGNVLMVSRLQEALQSNFIKHFIESNLDIDMEKLLKKMQVYDPAPPGWKGPCIKGATIGVTLLSLTKEHVDGQKAAVKDLSLTFHRGQITALLGPNGAGKTTVISLLTGLYPPSSGTIIINGKDIRTDLAAIRTELGVCPQYDVLFNVLTVREHLLLYGSVKAPGWTKEQLNQYVSGALEDVDLSQHQYKPVGALSGGMKRRLSIAISFIGNSKTVVLDEPTSGVDPCSRRSIWDVLLKYKSGCTLIFTTHHLDEAEVLSDRIAILQRGQLRCCGSPSYLRETYGQGHSLTLIKKPSVFETQDPKHIFRVTSLVQTHIPEAFLKENSGTELTYVIPERADKTSFKGLFQALDQSLHHLHVTGYGISDTTLEEMCPSFNISAPYVKNKKGHILYNLSGFLVEEYLVRPSNKARYGGWSFGGRKPFELQDTKLNSTKSKPLVKRNRSVPVRLAEISQGVEPESLLDSRSYCLVWYNQKAFHSLPSYLNELNNFILWLNLPPNADWRQYGITLYSQPYGGALLDEDKIMENVRQCGVALCIMLGFSILTASIGSAIVKDRVSGTKRLQHITGLGYKTYWLANFCCDMLFYMVPVTLCVGVISAFQLSAFTFRKNLAATVLLLIIFGGQCSFNSMVSPSEDVDVEMERQRLFGGRTGNDVLLLYNLRKCYGGFSKKNTAVESISLGIPRGECFGLLGTNGAGKSTTFKMLTGDIIPSAGRAVIRTPTGSEMDILSASSEGILIGYCPQQDALDELLTGWEHLYYYCTLRGIPKQDTRKDEPSSGMDPCSKRYLWKTILKEVQDGCAAVLTSHRFGDGYSVKVWLSKEISYRRMILDCLQLHFPGTQFKGQHLNLLEYHVPRSQGCLAELFRVLENHKAFLQIKHYSISQTTLEQVFINFATQQQGVSHSSEEPPVRCDHLPV